MSDPLPVVLRYYAVEHRDKEKDDKPSKLFHDDDELAFENREPFVTVFIDTETTYDPRQSLKFGSCAVRVDHKLIAWYLFYDQRNITIQEWAWLMLHKLDFDEQDNKPYEYEVLEKQDFLEQIFFPLAQSSETRIIGFNLPFDLSRLALDVGGWKKLPKPDSKKSGEDLPPNRKRGRGFYFIFSQHSQFPKLRIKSLNSESAFIHWISGKGVKYRSSFLDLRTFTFVLTNASHSLQSAGELYGCAHAKMSQDYERDINEQYIKYNENDVWLTMELYDREMEEFRRYKSGANPTRLKSAPSHAKAIFRKMGLIPFREANPDFPPEMLGLIMNTYYGGKTVCYLRKRKAPVTVLDATSMYPTGYTRLNLHKFLIAGRITYMETTDEVINFLRWFNSLNLHDEDLWEKLGKDFWDNALLISVVLVKANEDILTVRSYYDKDELNISVSYLTSAEGKHGIPYTLLDVLASVALTHKVPEIEKAFTFYAGEPQQQLKPVELFDFVVDPRQNFIKTLVELRQKVKREMKQTKDEQRARYLKSVEQALKVLVNGGGYGIYAEEDVQEFERDVDVFGDGDHFVKRTRYERPAPLFNPLIATMQTAYARFILGISEAYVGEENVYYEDSDSLMLNPQVADKLQKWLQPINPYDDPNIPVMKKDEVKIGKEIIPLDNVLFYGISSKRYCLFREDEYGEIDILKYSSHGLGALMLPDDVIKNMWKAEVASPAMKHLYLERIPLGDPVVSKYTISTPHIYNALRKLNTTKDYNEAIKPFSFMIVGHSTYGGKEEKGDPVIPLFPYTDNISNLFSQAFVDRNSGQVISENTEKYAVPLAAIISQYFNHKESKLDGNEGRLYRKHIVEIARFGVGKESNYIDESKYFGIPKNAYADYISDEDVRNFIMTLDYHKLPAGLISDRGLRKMRSRIVCGKPILRNRKYSQLAEFYRSLMKDPQKLQQFVKQKV